jgi:hypothetical protein
VPGASVTAAGIARVTTIDRSYQPPVRRRYYALRIGQLIRLSAAGPETLFAIGIMLKIVAANPAVGFVQFMTNTIAPFLVPFAGLTNDATSANGVLLQVATLIAMLVYALLARGIVQLIWIVFKRRIV